MSLAFAIVFTTLSIRAIIYRKYTYSGHTYDLKEHPVQFIITTLVIMAAAAFAIFRFLKDIEVI